MRIILSPAKKMNQDTDSLPPSDLPQFLPQAEQLKTALQALPQSALQSLWGCNDALAQLNIARLQAMNLHRNLTPALLAYEGIAYQYMAPSVFEEGHLVYVQQHLRILSGFYGILRPFDGVTSYRLEMQARLAVGPHKNLYAFWGNQLARQLASETDLVVNLASKEYSRAVIPHLPPSVKVLTCTFGELKGGKIVEKGILCKMARGQMVRWLAEQNIGNEAELRQFDQLGYGFSDIYSTPAQAVFLKGQGTSG